MRDSGQTDAELLADWVSLRHEGAFRQLVARYARLVHAAGKRTCGDDALAAETSQLVFILLARKAASLSGRTSLAGWLHLTAVMQAKNLMRRNRREARKRQHLSAAMDPQPPHASNNIWKEMQPVLDEALAALSEKDREALLLRFYRSLSIREIAITLGIATDAAQKRVDRATERLREKLSRRGCQAGGASLAGAMLAGFATDAQAAAPTVSLLTSHVLTGSTSITSKTFFSSLLIMETASFVSPAIVLVIAGAWIGSQRQTIHALDRQSELLQAAITEHSSTVSVSTDAPAAASIRGEAGGRKRIDWEQIVGKLAESDFSDVDQMMFDQQLSAMSAEELLEAMDEIGRLTASENIRRRLEELVVFPLTRKFPEFAVTRLTERKLDGGACGEYLANAMETWSKKDPEKALAWMDQQVGAGMFETKSLDGKCWTRILYEGVLIRSLLTTGGDRLSKWFGRLPAELHKDVLGATASVWRPYGKFEPAEEEALSALVREKLSSEDQADVLVQRVNQVSAGGLPAVDKFLETIKVTPEERVRCVGEVVSGKLRGVAVNRTVSRGDLVEMRDWMVTQTPQAVDRLTGEMLGSAAASDGIAPTHYQRMTYSEAAAFAAEFSESSGNDDVLAAFLKSEGGRSNKIQARDLARKISDETLRAEILKTLR